MAAIHLEELIHKGRSTREYATVLENSSKIEAGLQGEGVLFQVARKMTPELATIYCEPNQASKFVAEILKRLEFDATVFQKLTRCIAEIPSLSGLAQELSSKNEAAICENATTENAFIPSIQLHQSSDTTLPGFPATYGPAAESNTSINAVQPASTGIDGSYLEPSQETTIMSELVCRKAKRNSALLVQQELHDYQTHVDTAEHTVVKLREKVDRNRDRLDEKRYSRLDEELQQQRQSINFHRDQVASYERYLDELGNQCAEVDMRVKVVEKNQGELAEKVEDAEMNQDKVVERVEEVEKSQDKLVERVEVAMENQDEMEERVEVVEKSHNKLTERVGDTEKNQDELGERVGVMEKTQIENDEKVGEVQRSLEHKVTKLEKDLGTTREKLKLSKKESHNEVQALESKLEHSSLRSRDEIEALQDKAREAEQQRSELEETLSQANQRIAELEGKIESLQQAEQRRFEVEEHLQSLMQEIQKSHEIMNVNVIPQVEALENKVNEELLDSQTSLAKSKNCCRCS